MLDNLTQNDFQYANQISKNIDSIIPTDPDIPTNFFELSEKNIQLNSFTYAQSALEKKLQDAYSSRDAAMREQHIIPDADVTENGFDQDSLDAIDAQIEKLNKTTRVDAPFKTNAEIREDIANQVRRLQYEVSSGQEHEGFFANLAAHVGTWSGSIPYSYKRSLADVATNVAVAAGTALSAGLTGGASLAVDAAVGSGFFAADNVYDSMKENEALKSLGLEQESLKGAALSGAITGVVAAGVGVGIKSVTGVLGKKAGQTVAETTLSDAEKITTTAATATPRVPPESEQFFPTPPTTVSYSNFIGLSPKYAEVLRNGADEERSEIIEKLANTDHIRQQYDNFNISCKR